MGYEIYFFRFFEFFGPQMVKKRSNLYSNGRIHIQTIKFKFKRTNQKLAAHYRPPAPVAGGSPTARADLHIIVFKAIRQGKATDPLFTF
jgi:hypothetical protein